MLRSAGAMGLAVFFSRIAGLVREQVFAFFFGAGTATDAFNVAFRIPNLLRDLFAEGAMSAALVPTFTRVRTEQGERRAWRVAGLVFRALAVIAALIAALGILFAPQLVELYASAYKEVPGKFELTVLMTRIMYPFFPLVALAAAFMGILNACGRFFLSAFASALFNVTSIVLGVALALAFPRYGVEAILGMAIAVVVGGAVQAFCQLPQLRRAGYRWQPRTSEDPAWYRDPALQRMLTLMVPGLVGMAATQVNVLVNTILATSQQPGAVSWLNYAFRLMQFPIGIFGVSLAAATLPRVSQLWVDRDFPAAAHTLDRSLRRVFAVNLPASAGLGFLGFPIIQLLFQYGRFSEVDALATASALAGYSVGLTAYSVVKVLVPACYAFGNTRLPVISSLLSVAMTIGLNLALIGPLGFLGLALGTSAAAFFNALFLLIALRSLLGRMGTPFELGGLARSFCVYAGVAVLMGACCLLSQRFIAAQLPDSLVHEHFGSPAVLAFRALKVGFLVLEGVAIVVALGRVLRLAELTEAIDLFAGKLKKKLRRSGS